MYEQSDFRAILNDQFDARRRRNPQYSLRAFARDLGIAPSSLSDVLNKRYGLSRATSAKIARALRFSVAEQDFFCDLVESEARRAPAQMKAATQRVESRRKLLGMKVLRADRLRLVGEWYLHAAVLEMLYLANFRWCFDWIGTRLGLRAQHVRGIVERLERAGFLKKKGDEWSATEGDFVFGDDTPSETMRKLHEDLLENARDALTFQPADEREFLSLHVAIDTADIPWVKSEMMRFQREMATKLNQNPAKNRLYIMGMQFFAGDKPEKTH